MNTTLTINKIGSLFTSLTLLAGLCLGGSGCFVTTTEPDVTTDPTPVAPSVATVPIDPGATMASTPGQGVGLFAQYQSGGHWLLTTTCDTAVSGNACRFDVVISADPGVVIDNVEGQSLESTDSIALNSDGSINLTTDTSFGTDGITFDADPGATIEIDMLLDGVEQPDFVYVVSDGSLLTGVPSNPVDFAPNGQ